MTGEEIQRRLVDFGRRWSLYDGSERTAAGARFEETQQGEFLDLIWPRACIIEMKRPSEAGRLASHRDQALGYWGNAADPSRNVPAPRFVVLCAFQRFEMAYGWSGALLDDVRARNCALFERNAAILAGDLEYSPF